MESWLKISMLLSVFGFVREIRPSEPFVTDYLTDYKNITLDEVLRDLYPVGIYSCMAQAVIVFLITDFLRYKPLIFISGLSGVIVWGMLLWTDQLRYLQILEVFYGTYLATEVAYFTYIYAKVDREHFDQVTSHTRAAMFWGRFIACIVAQFLLYVNLMNYHTLNYITFGTQVICTLWMFQLPPVSNSIYFHRKQCSKEVGNELESVVPLNQTPDRNELKEKKLTPFELLWQQTKEAYSNPEVVQWSIWYALSTCGFYQITNYIQVLWNTIDNSEEMHWNGAVEAFVTLFSALVTTFAVKIHSTFLSKTGSLWTLTILTTFSGLSIVLGTKTSSLYISYLGYILFCTLFAFAITISSAEVAKRLQLDTFGLIFGINTFAALIMQSILTFVVVSETFIQLDVITQFLIYAGFYFVFAFLYILNIIFNVIMNKRDRVK